MKINPISEKKYSFFLKGIFIVSFVFILFTDQVKSAVPVTITYQSKIRDANGLPVHGSYNMRFVVYDDPSAGSALWIETYNGNNGTNKVTINSGILAVELNQYCNDWLAPTHANCSYSGSGVDWNNDYFLQVELDYDNNGTFEEVFSPRKRLTSVPTALNSFKLQGLEAKESGADEHIVKTDLNGNLTVSGDFYINGTTYYIDSTAGAVLSSLSVDGNVTFGDDAADIININASTVTVANSLNFDANTLYLDSTNNRVGLGTNAPARVLHVQGAMRLATTTTPTAPAAGDIYSDGADLFFYNGSGWDDLTGLGATDFLSLTDTPSSYNAGRILYQTATGLADDAGLAWDDTGSELTVTGDISFGPNGNGLLTDEATGFVHLYNTSALGVDLHLSTYAEFTGSVYADSFDRFGNLGLGSTDATSVTLGHTGITTNIIGNLGINTASPNADLEITGATNSEMIRLSDSVDSVGLYSVNADPSGSLSGNRGSLALDYTNGAVYVNTDDSTSWSQLGSGGSSVFTSSSGTITKISSTDQVNFTVAQSGDYGLKVDASVSPTSDLVQITNTGYATTTNGVDALSLEMVQGPGGTGEINSGLAVSVTGSGDAADVVSGVSIKSSGVSAGSLFGLEIGNIVGGSGSEQALVVGSGWDIGLDVDSPAQIGSTLAVSNQVTIGNSGNIFTFDPSSGPNYTGTARPTKSVVFSPEFAGASLTDFYGAGTDINTSGSFTSDTEISSGNNLRNFYQWSSNRPSLQSYTIALRITLPQDFSAWATSNALVINYATQSINSADNSLDLYLYLSSDDSTAVTSSTGLVSTSASGWEQVVIDDSVLDNGAAPEWDAAGETAMLYFRTSSQGGNFIRVGDVNLNYLAQF
ncbi:MAG: hypothetical protein GF332_00010 [Candidatus Moranbacteria bacterium]|nr:hypothetical protein [Candidatus Moranbacteria bacterium]